MRGGCRRTKRRVRGRCKGRVSRPTFTLYPYSCPPRPPTGPSTFRGRSTRVVPRLRACLRDRSGPTGRGVVGGVFPTVLSSSGLNVKTRVCLQSPYRQGQEVRDGRLPYKRPVTPRSSVLVPLLRCVAFQTGSQTSLIERPAPLPSVLDAPCDPNKEGVECKVVRPRRLGHNLSSSLLEEWCVVRAYLGEKEGDVGVTRGSET